MENKQIVCIDLGTSKLGISVAKLGKAGVIEVENYAEYPSQGIVHAHLMSSEKLKAALKYAIEQVEAAMGATIKEVVVSTQKYGVKTCDVEAELEITSGKSISKEDIENLCNLAWDKAADFREAGEDVTGLVPQAYFTEDEWNVNPNDIVGMRARRLKGNFKVFLANETIKANLEDSLREIGYPTAKIRFVPNAVGRSVLFANEMDSGVALIDFGAGACSVSVFEGGVLRHYGAVPFGGDSITADIRSICDIPEKLADSIKMGFGGCIPTKLGELGEKTLRITDNVSGRKVEISAKYLSEIIDERVKEIVDAMLYEIQKSGYAESLKCGIVLCGGCADMLNLKALISDRSGYTVRVGSPSRKNFNAKVNFFRPEAVASAGLIEDYVYDAKGGFIEEAEAAKPELSKAELFDTDQYKNEEPKKNNRPGLITSFRNFIGGNMSEEERHRKEEEERLEKEARLKKEEEKAKEIKAKKEEAERKKRERAQARAQRNDNGFMGSLFSGNDDDPKNQI